MIEAVGDGEAVEGAAGVRFAEEGAGVIELPGRGGRASLGDGVLAATPVVAVGDGRRGVAGAVSSPAQRSVQAGAQKAISYQYYIAGNNGQLPGDISQLESSPPVDRTVLQRYQLLQTGNLRDIPNQEPLVAENAPVDAQYNTLFKISATGYSYQGTGTSWVNGSGKGVFGTNITTKIKPFERQ